MYFIGHTRFSQYIPNSKAWNISTFSEDEYIDYLFSDERMNHRMYIFSKLSVPMLARMKRGYNYRHIVAYSSILPKKWKQELFTLNDKYPFLYLHEVDTDDTNPINSILSGCDNGAVAYFRLDDDDLLVENYLDELSQYNNSAFAGMAVSFGKGYLAHYRDRQFIDFRGCIQKFPSMGLASIGSFEDGRLELPKMYSHHNIDENLPVVVDSRFKAYIQTYHSQQDTHYRFNNTKDSIIASVENELLKYPKANDASELKINFPVLADQIDSFISNKTVLFKASQIDLIEKYNHIKVNDVNNSRAHEIEYLISTTKPITSSKAFVVSISFKEDQDSVIGLTCSPNPLIGWYKYIPLVDGICQGHLSFITNAQSAIDSIDIIKWDSRIEGASLISMEIIDN